MQADYLILGQGIAGTLLCRSLLKEGKKVIVIDDSNYSSASMASGGIINPVTGKRLVKSWMTDRLMPFAWDTYREMEQELDVSLIRKCDILDFHATIDMKTIFEERLNEDNTYLHNMSGEENNWQEYFRFNYGIGRISPCLLLDTQAMISRWREHWVAIGLLLEEAFHWEDCKVGKEHITYKNITAQKIICCEGASAEDSPYFKMLPWSKDKGEALTVSIPGLPETHIFKQGISIVPKGDGIFWVGASHDWKYADLKPTPGFQKKVEEQLDYWLRLPYEIVGHIVARRPANLERKPFVGLHPTYPEVGILNGMGGKGCSFAPLFASQLARHLAYGEPILPDADVRRFGKVLQRL